MSSKSSKRFHNLTFEELYYTLKGIRDNDCYDYEFFDSELLEQFLFLLIDYNIVFIASDQRVMLTANGEKLLQHLNLAVEINF